MRKIFGGALLVLLSINIRVGQVSLNLTPDFLGYILMLMGTNELMNKEQSSVPSLRSADIILKALIVASAVDYALAFLGINLVKDSVEGFFWRVLLIVGDLYCWKKIFEGISRIEKERKISLNTEGLTTAWWIYAASGVLSILGTWVPNSLMMIVVVLTLTAPFYFLYQMYKTDKAYALCGK